VSIQIKGWREQGLTLVESIVSATVFTLTMTGIGSIMVQQQIGGLDSQIKSGGVVAGQQVLDRLRQVPIEKLPSSLTSPVTVPPTNYTENFSTTYNNSQPITVAGRSYSATVYYCQDGTTYCDNNTRQIRVEVAYNGRTVYAISTVYTNLQQQFNQ
jgi:Tfp pilus assembly protein PilV